MVIWKWGVSGLEFDVLLFSGIQKTQNPPTRVGVTWKYLMQNPNFGDQSQIQNPKSKRPHLGQKERTLQYDNPKSKIRNPKSKIQNPKSCDFACICGSVFDGRCCIWCMSCFRRLKTVAPDSDLWAIAFAFALQSRLFVMFFCIRAIVFCVLRFVLVVWPSCQAQYCRNALCLWIYIEKWYFWGVMAVLLAFSILRWTSLYITSITSHRIPAHITSHDMTTHDITSHHIPSSHLISPRKQPHYLTSPHNQPHYPISPRNQPHDIIPHHITAHHITKNSMETQPATTKTSPPNGTAEGWCAQRTRFGQRTGWWPCTYFIRKLPPCLIQELLVWHI